jgi:hypothetical protein
MTRVGMMLASVFVVVGCGGGGVSLSSLGDEIEDSVCSAQVDCGFFPDMQSCLDTSFVNMDQAMASVDDGRAEYHSDQAGECADLFGSLSSCDILADLDLDALDEACDGVLTGLVELGGECYDSEECAGDAYCDRPCNSDECCAGACVADEVEPALVAIGADCSEADCVDGAYCDFDTDICVAAGNEGDACPGFGAQYCTAGLYCDAFFEDSTCYRPGAEGEECDPERGYGIVSCRRTDLWCDPADTTCKDRPAAGEACDVEIDNCIDYAYCVDGTCVAKPGVGGACGGETEIDCLGDLDCEGDLCLAPEVEPVCGPDSPA